MIQQNIAFTTSEIAKDCTVGYEKNDITITGMILEKSFKLFGKTILSWLSIETSAPYIKDPFYYGEFDTNTRLWEVENIVIKRLEDRIKNQYGNKRIFWGVVKSHSF